MKKIKLLKQFMKKNMLRYFTAIICSGIAVLVSIFNPLVISFTVDSLIGMEPMNLPRWLMRLVTDFGGKEALAQKLWIPGVIYISLTLLSGLFQYLRGRGIAISTESAAKKIRDTLYDSLQKVGLNSFIRYIMWIRSNAPNAVVI
jgi:ATP-binding cassette subfamily B protein